MQCDSLGCSMKCDGGLHSVNSFGLFDERIGGLCGVIALGCLILGNYLLM